MTLTRIILSLRNIYSSKYRQYFILKKIIVDIKSNAPIDIHYFVLLFSKSEICK